MIRSLIYIRLASAQPVTYTVPLLDRMKKALPGLTTFEFDNFSAASMRHYAATLLQQSEKVAIVVVSENAEASVAGLPGFFNRLLKEKPTVLLMVLQGEQPLLHKMMQAVAGPGFYHSLPEAQLQELLQKTLS